MLQIYRVYTDISCIHAFTVKIHAKPVTEINPSGLIYVTGLACIFIQQLSLFISNSSNYLKSQLLNAANNPIPALSTNLY